FLTSLRTPCTWRLSLHDALPILALVVRIVMRRRKRMLSHLKILLMPGVTAMAFLGARIGLELSGQDLAVYALLAFLLLIGTAFRSEEHTSELQTRFDLVCRLLLE